MGFIMPSRNIKQTVGNIISNCSNLVIEISPILSVCKRFASPGLTKLYKHQT